MSKVDGAESVRRTAVVRPSRRSWVFVAAAWLAVGLPLAWGVYKTLEKAALLFRGG